LIRDKNEGSISDKEYSKRKEEILNTENIFDNSQKQRLEDFNNGNLFKIEEININFKPVNPMSPIARFEYTPEQRADFIYARRLDNINKNKPFNSGLPESHEEGNAIAKMIEEGESRETIINFFQRSNNVMTKIIKRKLDGELESNDPYVLAAGKILEELKQEDNVVELFPEEDKDDSEDDDESDDDKD